VKILLDTSFLYALNDRRDRNHIRSTGFLHTLMSASLLLPTPVLPEVCYLLHSRLGHTAMRRFLSGLAASDIALESINTADIERVTEIWAQYADARLDFTDAAIVALA
jgi:predicted nucleic acid-binding protein